MRVVKNTLARKALEAATTEETKYEGLFDSLKGPTALLFTEVANAPARVLRPCGAGCDAGVSPSAWRPAAAPA